MLSRAKCLRVRRPAVDDAHLLGRNRIVLEQDLLGPAPLGVEGAPRLTGARRGQG